MADAPLPRIRTRLEESLSPDLGAVLAELATLRAKVEAMENNGYIPRPAMALSPPEQLVTLSQAAAMVHRSKRTLDRYRRRMPPPRSRGRTGKPSLWAWQEIRPWLESTFEIDLPEFFPGGPF